MQTIRLINKYLSSIVAFLLLSVIAIGQVPFSDSVIVGAEQVQKYLPLLKNKNVAIVANQTSLIKHTHLVDSLLALGVDVKLVFSPEHGFRGRADAGEKVDNYKDLKTGLPIVSLYGKHKKPTKKDLQDIDIVIFDIQDVGVRYYTYISTLHYILEACAENYIQVLVLDRPNPNGYYVDGPVLAEGFSSFVGKHKVPLVHGMTIGEYALMINGEGWLADSAKASLMIMPCEKYNHSTLYKLPVKPSPNLPNIRSVLLYPSLGFFEGTVISVGRGTPYPFQVYGHPEFYKASFKFTPISLDGAKSPKYKNEECIGVDLRELDLNTIIAPKQINLSYIIDAYSYFYGSSESFFNSFFKLLAGNNDLKQQLKNRISELEIRESWKPGLNNFKRTRKKYLLYTDFE